MARSPIPDLIKAFQEMTPEERACFLDLVDPQPEPEPAKQKRKRKKATPDGKSEHALSLKEKIQGTPDTKSNSRCVFQHDDERVCGEVATNPVHDPNGGYAGYHVFVAPVDSAGKRSSRKGAAASNTANTEAEMESAIGASGD